MYGEMLKKCHIVKNILDIPTYISHKYSCVCEMLNNISFLSKTKTKTKSWINNSINIPIYNNSLREKLKAFLLLRLDRISQYTC